MNHRRLFSSLALVIFFVSQIFGGNIPAAAQTPQPPLPPGGGTINETPPRVTQAERQAAADRAAEGGLTLPDAGTAAMAMPD